MVGCRETFIELLPPADKLQFHETFIESTAHLHLCKILLSIDTNLGSFHWKHIQALQGLLYSNFRFIFWDKWLEIKPAPGGISTHWTDFHLVVGILSTLVRFATTGMEIRPFGPNFGLVCPDVAVIGKLFFSSESLFPDP